MGFNLAFKGFKIVKNPMNGRLNNLNDPVLNALSPTYLNSIIFNVYNSYFVKLRSQLSEKKI
jgi:hypothetical protein